MPVCWVMSAISQHAGDEFSAMWNFFKQIFSAKTPTSATRDDSLIVEAPTNFPVDMRKMSRNDLENIYTGGDCYQLALAMHDMDPARFTMWEITSRTRYDGSVRDEYSAHWVVRDNKTGKFVDAYGSHRSIKRVLDGWDDFEGDTTVRYYERKDRNEAIAIMNRSFGDPAFWVGWRENALYAVKALKLI